MAILRGNWSLWLWHLLNFMQRPPVTPTKLWKIHFLHKKHTEKGYFWQFRKKTKKNPDRFLEYLDLCAAYRTMPSSDLSISTSKRKVVMPCDFSTAKSSYKVLLYTTIYPLTEFSNNNSDKRMKWPSSKDVSLHSFDPYSQVTRIRLLSLYTNISWVIVFKIG